MFTLLWYPTGTYKLTCKLTEQMNITTERVSKECWSFVVGNGIRVYKAEAGTSNGFAFFWCPSLNFERQLAMQTMLKQDGGINVVGLH